MLKKYVVIALGALLIANQANSMSYLRGLFGSGASGGGASGAASDAGAAHYQKDVCFKVISGEVRSVPIQAGATFGSTKITIKDAISDTIGFDPSRSITIIFSGKRIFEGDGVVTAGDIDSIIREGQAQVVQRPSAEELAVLKKLGSS